LSELKAYILKISWDPSKAGVIVDAAGDFAPDKIMLGLALAGHNTIERVLLTGIEQGDVAELKNLK